MNYPEYFAKLHRMQTTYGDQIVIKKGLEFGIQSHTVESFSVLFERYRSELDFVLFSMRQVEDMEFWTQAMLKRSLLVDPLINYHKNEYLSDKTRSFMLQLQSLFHSSLLRPPVVSSLLPHIWYTHPLPVQVY